MGRDKVRYSDGAAGEVLGAGKFACGLVQATHAGPIDREDDDKRGWIEGPAGG